MYIYIIRYTIYMIYITCINIHKQQWILFFQYSPRDCWIGGFVFFQNTCNRVWLRLDRSFTSPASPIGWFQLYNINIMWFRNQQTWMNWLQLRLEHSIQQAIHMYTNIYDIITCIFMYIYIYIYITTLGQSWIGSVVL